MITTMHENGNTYKVEYKKVSALDPTKKHIFINGKPHQLISKVRTNLINVNEKNRIIDEYLNRN